MKGTAAMEFADRLREFAARVKIVPEYTVDVGIKKGEKVDYAIIDKKQNPFILIEAKHCGDDEQNKMDKKPFLVVNLLSLKDSVIPYLQKFESPPSTSVR